MRKIVTVAILMVSPFLAFGATKFDIIVRLPDYDLTQGGGASSGNELRATVASDSETILDKFSKDFRYNKEFSAKGKPAIRRTAYLGARIFIHVAEQDDKINLVVRIELCEQENPLDPYSEITKSTTRFQGRRDPGIPFLIDAHAPGNKTTRVEITLTKR